MYAFTDEYNATTQGYQCGHSVMNGPATNNITDYCTGESAGCTTGTIYPNGNHNADCVTPSGNPVQLNDGNWVMAKACLPAQFAYYYPIGTPNTPDPEPWSTWDSYSDIWQTKGYTTITQVN